MTDSLLYSGKSHYYWIWYLLIECRDSLLQMCVFAYVCFQGRALLVARSEQAHAACGSVSPSRGHICGRTVCTGHQPAAQTLVHPHWTRRHGPSPELGTRRSHRQVHVLTTWRQHFSFINQIRSKMENVRFYFKINLQYIKDVIYETLEPIRQRGLSLGLRLKYTTVLWVQSLTWA